METSLSSLIDKCHSIAKEKGFWDKERNIGEMLMLVVSELGEAMEALRKDRRANLYNQGQMLTTVDFTEKVKDTFEDELADAVIRLFDMAGGLGIPLEQHIELKLSYNATRERLHGKKF